MRAGGQGSTELEFPTGKWLAQLLEQSLSEDVGSGDVSTAVAVAPATRARGRLVARAAGVVAGLPLLPMLYDHLAAEVKIELTVADGAAVTAGQMVAELSGPAAPLLTGERTALNFLQQLSGIATLTARYVAAVAGTGCRILDTRKTVPGYRRLAKYAVRAGGGSNHRLGLYDRVLLKDNHWAASGVSIAELVARARREYPALMVEVEVDTGEQLDRVLELGVDWILLDNFEAEAVAAAVRRRAETQASRDTLLEASGNIDLQNVRAYAEAGVDAVSVGRLTHSAPALDLSLDLELEDT